MAEPCNFQDQAKQMSKPNVHRVQIVLDVSFSFNRKRERYITYILGEPRRMSKMKDVESRGRIKVSVSISEKFTSAR